MSVQRVRLGFGGSQQAAMKAAGLEGFGGDFWGLPIAVAVGLWWWVRGAPPASPEGSQSAPNGT
jgi:hypothetical protein